MPPLSSLDNEFLENATEIIHNNISDEYFGVSELAREIGMSRSNLLRKLRKLTNSSVSQFIREIRLQHSMEILKENKDSVSEIAFKVGFSSTSYFIKCFREYYGFPPGQVLKGEFVDTNNKTESSSNSHRLVAIMFTDIEGYTALMQKDERKALSLINRHREIFNRITKKHEGKILQFYGDGTLSTFDSAIDAVNCAIEMQLAFQQDPIVPVRIGIHSGDIMFTKDGAIGDGVNVASRIESLATVGSVFISGKVYDEVKNQGNIKTISLGSFDFKNVGKPMEVYAIINPGLQVPNRESLSGKLAVPSVSNHQQDSTAFKWILIPLLLMVISLLLYNSGIFNPAKENTIKKEEIQKSIAVLPFINDSDDSSNVYFINGLMESTLNNLQKIGDLRVISRTSVEKYRNQNKSMPEIADELNVKYIVEGSGQMIGDQILLNIQFIDGQNDKQLWSHQYNRKLKDVFALQIEVAQKITEEIEVIITPEEEKRIQTVPTQNVVAYDHFLKGLNILNTGNKEQFNKAILHFKDAIQQDPKFARAYSGIAIAYYYLDEFKENKEHTQDINYYADQALLYDAQLPQSLIAKALYYMNSKEYEFAESYFEKALEFSPNYGLVYIFLVDLYTNYLPNTEKYLQYALKGIQLEATSFDSVTTSFMYLHISNAFIQAGFVDEADKYISKSLVNYPDNLYAELLNAYILFAKNNDLYRARDHLKATLAKDTTRVDIIQEIGKIFYYLRDYENSGVFYEKFLDVKRKYKLNIYPGENAKISYVYSKLGKEDMANKLLGEYKLYAESDNSIYKDLSMASYYAYNDDIANAIRHLQKFSEQDNYHYWTLLFTRIDPLFENVKNHPEFENIMKRIEENFWAKHEDFRISLAEKNLL